MESSMDLRMLNEKRNLMRVRVDDRRLIERVKSHSNPVAHDTHRHSQFQIMLNSQVLA